MPVYVGSVVAPPEAGPQQPTPAPRPSEFLRMALSRGGDTIVLSRRQGGPWSVRYDGIEGLDVPATELIEERAAGQWGAFAVGVDVGAREVFLPLRVTARTLTELLREKDRFRRVTSPLRTTADGTAPELTRLTITRPDATKRSIEGYRVGPGPTWAPGTWEPWVAHHRFGLLLRCPDPWWRGGATTFTWKQATGWAEFFPITPVSFPPSRMFGTPARVDVAGDIASPPGWKLGGPFTEVTATHVQTGRSWTLTATVTAGQTVTVNTDQRVAATGLPVVGPGGEDWFDRIAPPFDLWRLPIGQSDVLVEVTGTGEGTRVEMVAPHLWETV